MKNEIGRNLSKIRKMKGLTQKELSSLTGISQRMITYYEIQSDGEKTILNHIISFAKALKVSADEILGLKDNFPERTQAENIVWKKTKKIIQLSPKDQDLVFQLIKTLTSANLKNKKK